MLKTQQVVGTLIPTAPTAVTENTSRKIHSALVSAGLHGMVSYWPTGHMELNQTAYNDWNSSPLDFVERLKRMTQRAGIIELRLSGEISLSETGNNPMFLRVRVEEGEVSYQEVACDREELVTG